MQYKEIFFFQRSGQLIIDNISDYNIFGIRFINGSYIDAMERLRNGGFMVVPSGPGLATIGKDLRYTEAVQNSDFAIPDSGFMVLLYRMFKGKRIRKLSGAMFIKLFVNEPILKDKNKLFLVDPNIEESEFNRNYLNGIGIPLSRENQYIAPVYDKIAIVDTQLLYILENLKEKPKFIVINLGSGIQERLGYYLKNNLSFTTGIICSGAAIAFLTGAQAKIPDWVDKIYCGWLCRIIQNPNLFLNRYIKAFRLLYVFYIDKKGKLI